MIMSANWSVGALQVALNKYKLMHGCFHIGFHIRPDSPYLPDEGGQI
jgi:hypothetical protein